MHFVTIVAIQQLAAPVTVDLIQYASRNDDSVVDCWVNVWVEQSELAAACVPPMLQSDLNVCFWMITVITGQPDSAFHLAMFRAHSPLCTSLSFASLTGWRTPESKEESKAKGFGWVPLKADSQRVSVETNNFLRSFLGMILTGLTSLRCNQISDFSFQFLDEEKITKLKSIRKSVRSSDRSQTR